MRKIIVAGNWKMNLNVNEAVELYSEVAKNMVESEGLERVIVFPPFPYLSILQKLEFSGVELGAQNIASEEKGAYTGEVSAAMIASMGFRYTLVGHSERRTIFGEDTAMLKKKVDLALANGLSPVFCCGEQLDEREAGEQYDVVARQLRDSLFHIGAEQFSHVIIAYEPVWAIGTGKTASVDQAEDMHRHIRDLVKDAYGAEAAESLHILYGGSCNSANSGELFQSENVDGGLIGGASLKSEEFLKIISGLDV